MDAIKYVNSKNIRKHLYATGYILNGSEMLFIIDNCQFITLEEKLNLLEALQDEKDEDIILCDMIPEPQRHTTLHKFSADLKNKYLWMLNKLKQDTFDSIYTLSSCQMGCQYFTKCGNFLSFSDFEDYVRNRFVNDGFNSCFELSRVQTFNVDQNHSHDEIESYLTAYYDENFNLMDLEAVNYDAPEELPDFHNIDTVNLKICLPTPFKKGDIIVHAKTFHSRLSYTNRTEFYDPLVVEQVFPSGNIDSNSTLEYDRKVLAYYADNMGKELRSGFFEHLYDFEMFERELSSQKKILTIVSGYLKKQIRPDDFLVASIYNENLVFLNKINKKGPSIEDILSGHNISMELVKDEHLRRFRQRQCYGLLDLGQEHITFLLTDSLNSPKGYHLCRNLSELKLQIKSCEKKHVIIDKIFIDKNMDPQKFKELMSDINAWLEHRQIFYKIDTHT